MSKQAFDTGAMHGAFLATLFIIVIASIVYATVRILAA
jgi:hypothetical protein